MKPRVMPIPPWSDTRSPDLRNRSMMTIQNGAVATSSAASPLGTHNSAQTTPRLPAPTSRNPINARLASVRKSTGMRWPRIFASPSITRPAMTKRVPESSSGGTVSSAMAMPR